jgi:hypothetical protein
VVVSLARLAASVPVDPDAPEAQQWLRDELAKPPYQAAQPTWFDRISGAIYDWFLGLDPQGAGAPPALGTLVIVLAIVAAIVVAFLIFGLPRLNRRSRVTGSLFGDDDARTAAVMRKAAEEAARAGDYAMAIAEMFRSIARGLAERTVLTTSPGTTAHDFATRAGFVFPTQAPELVAAAAAFDDVRYLGRDGTAEQFAATAALEATLRTAKPVALEVIGA